MTRGGGVDPGTAAPPPVQGRDRGAAVVLAVAVAMAVSVLSGCTSDASAGDSPPLGAATSIRSQADLVLPMDHYLPKPRERAAIATAKSELTAQCMERLGFKGYPVDSWAGQAKVPLHGNNFTVVDESNARKYGYSASFDGPLLAEADEMMRRFDGWDSPEVSIALNGNAVRPTSLADARGDAVPAEVPSGGCVAEGARALYALVGATAPVDVFWMDNLAGQAFARAGNDGRLVAPTAAWSACMKEAGYDFREPIDANNDPRWGAGPGGGDVEGGKRAALADVHCKWSSGYIDMFVALDAAYENQLIETNAERLQDALDTRQRLLAAMAAHGLGRIRDVGEK